MGTKGLSRRGFVTACCKGLFYLSFVSPALFSREAHTYEKSGLKGEWGLVESKLSPYFRPLSGGEVQCLLCPRQCAISSKERGYCEVRENRGGKLYSVVYGNPCSVQVDPIEKKPFFHVLPGTSSFSIATTGCNFDCKFCQNWETSQTVPEKTFNFRLPPTAVVEMAQGHGCPTIACTYVEPTIFFEYMYAISVLAKKKGILSVYHSNGYINPKPLDDLCHYLGAACIDLKGFTEEFYREMTEGQLSPVMRTIKTLRSKKIHLELVNLVVPTKNDDMRVVRQMCLWIKRELGADVPIHFTRFQPQYKLRNLPPTPVETLEQAREVAISIGLEYVYIGNVPGHEGENTYCPRCKKVLIARMGYFILASHVIKGKCKYCGKEIAGIWQKGL